MNNSVSEKAIDTVFRYFGTFLAALGFFVAAGMVLYLLYMSFPALSEVGITRFLTDENWYPDSSGEGTYGLFPMVIASLFIGA